MRMAFPIFNGSSSIRTTSAASIAASEPRAPIAIPISALERTGASLIPSPTKASFSFSDLFARSSSTLETLSAGRSSLWTSPIPRSAATDSATFFPSPVSITVLVMPAFFRFSIASLAWGLIMSEIRMWPAYFPSTAIWTTVPTWWHSLYAIPRRFISFALPAATDTPSTFAITPFPPISSMSVTRLRSIGLPYAFWRLLLMGCEEEHSAYAAYSRSFASSISLWWIPLTSNTPFVIVPVLSKTTIFVWESVSR